MRYWAFISYSSTDRALGERVHRAIVHYRVPKSLRGTDRGCGMVPKYLAPLFRDRSGASASGDLADEIERGLENSDALVVLCSPASAQSTWVNREIRRFKSLGRGARIYCVILDGTPRRFDPEAAPDGAFPAAIFERVDAAGHVIASDGPDPLAADVRPSPLGDGFEPAILKVVASLTNVPLPELTEQHLDAKRRERVVVRRVAIAMGILAIIAAGFATYAYHSAEAARTRLAQAIAMASRRVDDGAQFGDRYGVPVEVIGELLTGAERDFEDLIGSGDTGIPILELERGRLLSQFARFYGSIGDSVQQTARAKAALDRLGSVSTSRAWLRPSTWVVTLPSRTAVTEQELSALLALADAEESVAGAMAILEDGLDRASRADLPQYVGRFCTQLSYLYYLQANAKRARELQDRAIAAFEVSLTRFPDSSVAERAEAWSQRAELLLETEQHKEALADQAKALRAFREIEAVAPSNARAMQDTARALMRHADMLQAVSGQWAASMPEYEQALSRLDSIHLRDPTRIDYARDVGVVLERLGDATLQTAGAPQAKPFFDRLVAAREAAYTRNHGDPQVIRDFALAIERQGDLALAERQAAQALRLFERQRSIHEERRALPGEAGLVLARDLAAAWAKIGQARQALTPPGNWAGAYEEAIGLMTPLIDGGEAPPGWKRDVAMVRIQYGDALRVTGRPTDARSHWTTALALIESQLAINQKDPRLLADKAMVIARLGPAPLKRTSEP